MSSIMCAKASLLDINQEQYANCECFSDLMSVRVEKARAKQVALCFWCGVPLRTNPPTYDRRSCRRRLPYLEFLRGLKESTFSFLRRCPQQMSTLLSGRSVHLEFSFVSQFVVIWIITYCNVSPMGGGVWGFYIQSFESI